MEFIDLLIYHPKKYNIDYSSIKLTIQRKKWVSLKGFPHKPQNMK